MPGVSALLIATLLAPTLSVVAFSTQAVAGTPEPGGYKMDHYREPVPATLHGARVIHTGELARLITTSHPLLIDVLPAPTPPPDARPGLPRMPLPHRDIPGSLWLADTGRGALAPQTEALFRSKLREGSGRPVVFYCLSQCWMSWNAAKRALAYGIADVIWYPEGADGWAAAGLATAIAEPVTR